MLDPVFALYVICVWLWLLLGWLGYLYLQLMRRVRKIESAFTAVLDDDGRSTAPVVECLRAALTGGHGGTARQLPEQHGGPNGNEEPARQF